ncbi:hypothetical protein DOU54_10640 [Agrobacterium sp. MS2]|nr:hypothetical protein DOU54_10640 [Agrobacterium sp. MS2]
MGKLFKDADDRYNSGLFHFNPKEKHATEADTLTLTLTIDDAPLREIIESLYPPNPYEFSVIPADILGQVYERFLGKVIEIDGNKAIIQEKPEVKKAGGVYYTPSYIVEHIIKGTVDKIISGRTPKQVEKIKILDPACGSGSFLIVAYQHLLDWHLNYYSSNGGLKKFKKELHQTDKGNLRLTTQIRKSILLNNIFGVDIDPQAVEVTKLALLLKVLEGENAETIGKNLTLFHERALPDLGANIKCGNSLINSDFYEEPTLPELSDDDHFRVNAFDWPEEFQDIFREGKFDVVIGNPPYGATLYPMEKDFLQGHFTHQSYQLDSYLLFMEMSIKSLLKKDAFWGMIIPNPWLSNIRQDKLRRLVMGNTRIEQIIHFQYPVFKRVVVDTEVVIFQNGYKKGQRPEVYVVPTEPAGELLDGAKLIEGNQDDWLKLADKPINVFLSDAERKLRNKVFDQAYSVASLFKVNVGIKPYQVGKGKPPQKKADVENRIFDASKKLTPRHRQYLRGKDIGRYEVNPLEKRYIEYGPWLAEPRPAADFDADEKILVRQTGDQVVAAMDTEQHLCLNNLHVLAPKEGCVNTYGILALLNSSLMTWCLQAMNPEAGEALAEVKKEFVEMLPLPDPAKLSNLDAVCRSLIKLKKSTSSIVIDRQIRAHLSKIDEAVYKLYGLSAAEISLVQRNAD